MDTPSPSYDELPIENLRSPDEKTAQVAHQQIVKLGASVIPELLHLLNTETESLQFRSRIAKALGELRDLGVALPLVLAKRMRSFDWTTDLRYETGRRDTGETVAFLNTAKAIYDWVEGQLP